HGSRTRDELNLPIAHCGTYTSKTAHDERNMSTEKSIIHMQFIDHHELQVLQKGPPATFLRQNGDVQHVRIGKDNAPFVADQIPLFHWRVPIKGLHDHVLQTGNVLQHLLHTPALVLSKGFGREDVHSSTLGIVLKRMQHWYLVDQRLSRTCRR